MGGLIYSVEKFLLGWTRIVRRLVSLFAFKINCLVSVLCGSLLKGITEETVKLVFFACVCVCVCVCVFIYKNKIKNLKKKHDSYPIYSPIL